MLKLLWITFLRGKWMSLRTHVWDTHCEEDKSSTSIHTKSIRIQNRMTKSYYINQKSLQESYMTWNPCALCHCYRLNLQFVPFYTHSLRHIFNHPVLDGSVYAQRLLWSLHGRDQSVAVCCPTHLPAPFHHTKCRRFLAWGRSKASMLDA